MTDDRGWGPVGQCEALAPDGQQCALAQGHDGNHRNAYDVTNAKVSRGWGIYIAITLVLMLILFGLGWKF